MYPIRAQKVVFMNASFVMRIIFSLSKIFFSKAIRERQVLVYNMDAYLLNSPYPKYALPKQFNGLIDHEDLQKEMSEKIKERYTLASTFKL